MRRLLEHLHRTLHEFIEQRDDLLLVAACTGDVGPLLLKALRSLEHASGCDVHLMFADMFTTADAYVTAVVGHLREEHRIADAAAVEDGKSPVPPPPAALDRTDRPPVGRMEAAITYARSLFTSEGNRRLVWTLCPTAVEDPQAYDELLDGLVPTDLTAPWVRGVRLIVRVDPAGHALDRLRGRSRVRVHVYDFGSEQVEAALREEADDPAASEPERMQALLQTAYFDHANSRVSAAVEKFQRLAAYYRQTEQPMLEAVAHAGLGDVARHRQRDLEKAQEHYQNALEPAVAAQQPVVLAVVVENLGEVTFQRGEFALATGYYGCLVDLKDLEADPAGKAMALERKGLSLERQGEPEAALACWDEAFLLGAGFELATVVRSNLDHLIRVCGELRHADRAAQYRAERGKW